MAKLKGGFSQQSGRLIYAILAACLGATSDAHAAKLPGWSRTCLAPNWQTGQVQPVPDINVNDPTLPYWGFASRQPDGSWLIRFNLALIDPSMATPDVLKFLFYHECAHAVHNSSDEVVADCAGLDAMDGDVGVTDKAFQEIAAVYARYGRSFPSGSC